MSLPHLSPRVARAIGDLGRVLIGAGVLILLFAIYQLWGTGLQHSRSQDRLDQQFAEQLEAFAPTTTTPPPVDDPATTPVDPATPTTTTTPPTLDELDEATIAALTPEPGDPVARIWIPTIGVDEAVVHGVSTADLRLGPGHYPDSPLPGQPGNAAIAGHRTTYGQPFHDLDKLQPGDEIRVQTVQGEFTYEVMAHEVDGDPAQVAGHFIVDDNAVEVLDDAGDDRLTLTACHPKYSSRQRIVVTAALQDPPAPRAPPREVADADADGDVDGDVDGEDEGVAASADGFGEGLEGDPSARTPTLVWGALFLLALAAIIVVGARWRRWTAYALGSPVLVWLLFNTFIHLDQFLPSY
ncbi:MAG: class E sortase [Acidimicrobiia bacterium]|nr:class E sortase [Acidimicrobiia bacterium]